MAVTETNVAHGKDMKKWLNEFDVSGYANNVAPEFTVDEAEAPSTGTWKSYKAGQISATVNIDALYDHSTGGDTIRSEVESILGSEEQRFILGIAGATVGYPAFCGKGQITKHAIRSTVTEVTKFSAGLRMTNAMVSDGHILHSGTETATGAEDSVDAGAARIGAAGYVAVLSVTSASASDTIDVLVEHSANNADWSTLVTFTQATDETSQCSIALTGAVYRYRRASWTIAGTDPSFAFTVAFGELK